MYAIGSASGGGTCNKSGGAGDAAPSATAAPLAVIQTSGIAPLAGVGVNIKIRTSAAGLIAARSSIATVDLYAVVTMGFVWARRD